MTVIQKFELETEFSNLQTLDYPLGSDLSEVLVVH